MDLRSPELAGVFEQYKPQAVAHLAAQIDVRRSVEEPAFDADINIIGGINLLENCVKHGAEKVIFVITTDGLENASKRFSYEKIRRMIEREKEQSGWEFLFLGANMDAVKEAARFGISSDRAVRFENDAQGVAVNYHVVSETVSRMREAPCCASIGAEWKEQIEADFQKRHHG